MRYLYLLSIMAFCVSCSCGSKSSSARRVVRPVKSVVAESVTYIERDFAGMATSDNSVTMAFKISGQVERVAVSTGSEVVRGELLVELDPIDIELQVRSDESAYYEAESRLHRINRLLERNAVSTQEAEAAEAAFVRSQSTLENSRELLAQSKLIAPFSGVVERIYVDDYQRVMAGESVIRIVSRRSSTVEFTITENSLQTLTAATTRFAVEFEQYPNMRFDATLDSYARTSSDASGLPVALNLVNPDSERYKITPGLSCNVIMSVEQSDSAHISLPISAIYAPARGGSFVWVIGENNRVTLRPVALGDVSGGNSVVITSGVEAGERVVSAGVYQLQEGDSVRNLTTKEL